MKGFLIAIATLLARLIAPFIVPIALLFRVPFFFSIKGADGKVDAAYRAYRLPNWAKWFDTPDMSYPGDLGIKSMSKIQHTYGDFAAAWVWLSFRNVFFGFAWQFGKEANNYMAHLSPVERYVAGVQERTYRGLGLEVFTGWAVYRDWYGVKSATGFWAVPRFSIRIAKNND